MTDEEMAEEYADKILFDSKYPFIFNKEKVKAYIIKVYLDSLKCCEEAYNKGLKAGKDMAETDLATIAYMQGAERYKLKWHNLQKDPNDVPNDNRYVWTNVGAGYHDDDGWWDDFGRLQNVTAWCEPKFKE